MDENRSDSFAPYHAGPQANQPMPPSRRKTSPWAWVVVVLFLLTVMPFLCCGGMAILGVGTFMTGIRAPVNAAIESMNDDPAIADKLGTPITASTSFGVNEYQNHNGDGHAEVRFKASGPRGSATVKGRMNLQGHVWSPENLTITCDDDTELTLP